MNTKILSASLSIMVGTLLLFMLENPRPNEAEAAVTADKEVEISAPETRKETLEQPAPRQIHLPDPPVGRSTPLPSQQKGAATKDILTREKIRLTPLKPESFTKKMASLEGNRRPLKPATGLRRRQLDPEKRIEKQVAKATSEGHVSRTLTVQEAKNGRKLLRILEAGEGPVVILSWPIDKSKRDRVYSILRKCYSMKTVVYVENSGLYRNEDPAGTRWMLNTDAMSTFIRRPSGGVSAREEKVIASINIRHSLQSGMPVRIFPRRADAALLGGLKRLVGNAYSSAGKITAEYFIYGSGVGLTDVQRDGTPVAGRFVLPVVRKCR